MGHAITKEENTKRFIYCISTSTYTDGRDLQRKVDRGLYYFIDGYKTTLLHLAVLKTEDLVVLRILLNDPNCCPIRSIDCNGNTPLELAALLRKKEMIRLLLSHATPVKKGLAIYLRSASRYGDDKTDCEIVDMMLKGKCDPNVCFGEPLLVNIHMMQCVSCVKSLLEAGADPNKGSVEGDRPIENASFEVAKLLLDAGAIPVKGVKQSVVAYVRKKYLESKKDGVDTLYIQSLRVVIRGDLDVSNLPQIVREDVKLYRPLLKQIWLTIKKKVL